MAEMWGINLSEFQALTLQQCQQPVIHVSSIRQATQSQTMAANILNVQNIVQVWERTNKQSTQDSQLIGQH